MNDTSAESETNPEPSTRSTRRRYVFRLVAVIFPVVGLLFGNWVFYLLEFGVDTSLVVPLPKSTVSGWHVLNGDVDAAYWDMGDLSGPESRPFVLPQSPDLFRVVVVGASTVEGFPWPTELAFSRQIELILQKQLSKRTVEVLNCGIVGITSFQVLDLVRQSVTAEPDIIVVYSGHNEFYGPGGVSSKASSTLTLLRRYRLPQLLMRAIAPEPDPTNKLAQLLMQDRAIPLDGTAFETSTNRYRENLEQIVAVGTDHNIPIVFCSVACNLSDQSPIQSISATSVSKSVAENRDELLSSAASLINEDCFSEALELADRARALDVGYALAHYRRGQCLAGLGERDSAAAAFSRARDLDGCRFRAPSAFARIVRETAIRSESNFVDCESLLNANSSSGAAGNDLFFEHVHFTQKASWIVADAIARVLLEDVENASWSESRVPIPDKREEVIGLRDVDRLMSISLIHDMLSSPPFNAAADVEQQSAVLERQFDKVLARLSDSMRSAFSQVRDSANSSNILERMAAALHYYKHDREAEKLLRCNVRRRPWDPQRYLLLGEFLSRTTQTRESREILELGLSRVCDGWKHQIQTELDAGNIPQ
jgi:tetratricopeptide (TPR) repeat protein